MTFGTLGGCSKQQPRTEDGMEEEATTDETTRLVVPIVAATSTRTAATAANKKETTSQTSSTHDDDATDDDDDDTNTPHRRQSIVEPRDIVGLGIDILIFVSVQFVLRTQFHCSNIKTCESPQIIPYGRGFFFLTIVVLTTIYSFQIAVAKALLQTRRRRRNSEEHTTPLLPTTTTTRMTTDEEEEEIAQDIQILQKKLLKGLVKPCILGTLHFTLGLMALLFVSSCRAINSLPFWRQRDRSYYYKYGRGRTRNE